MESSGLRAARSFLVLRDPLVASFLFASTNVEPGFTVAVVGLPTGLLSEVGFLVARVVFLKGLVGTPAFFIFLVY